MEGEMQSSVHERGWSQALVAAASCRAVTKQVSFPGGLRSISWTDCRGRRSHRPLLSVNGAQSWTIDVLPAGESLRQPQQLVSVSCDQTAAHA